MKWYWKIALWLCALLVLGALLEIGLNAWIRNRLPKILNENNKSAYAINYKTLEVSLWDSNIDATEIIVVPKVALKDTLTKSGIYGKVTSVAVRDFKIWPLLFDNKIKARSISINKPEVVIYKKSDRYNNGSKSFSDKVAAPFEQLISVTDIFIRHGDLKMVYLKNNQPLLSVQNINLTIDGVVITDDILKRKIPFSYKNYRFDCDSAYYRPNEFYDITTKKIATTNNELTIDHFAMQPRYSRVAFVRRIPKEKDLFTLRSKKISLNKMDWGFKGDDFFFHTDAIIVDHAAANIYRSKLPPDDLRKKYLYNKLLRDLKFDLKVGALKIKNSLIEYEESKDFEKGAGKVSFHNFYMTATNICSGFKRKKAADLKIRVKCRFMNASPLDVAWNLNVMDRSDGFHIAGTLVNFDAAQIVPFTKPYMNVTTRGIIDELHFSFTGNDARDSGEFAVKYDDLKFTVFKKNDRKKKNKVLTFIGNLLVKNDTKGKVKNAHVALDRIPEKSFYNFLWRSIADGLKQILI